MQEPHADIDKAHHSSDQYPDVEDRSWSELLEGLFQVVVRIGEKPDMRLVWLNVVAEGLLV